MAFSPVTALLSHSFEKKFKKMQILPYFHVRIGFQVFYFFINFIPKDWSSLGKKVPEKVEGAKSCKTNTPEKKFFTRILRNSVTHFTLKSSLPHPLLQNHSTVCIFLPSVPSSHIILRLEISFLQLVGHSGSWGEVTHGDSPKSAYLNSQLPQFLLPHNRWLFPLFFVGHSNFSTA